MVIELTEAEAAYLREYRVKDSAHWNKAQMAAEEAEETKKRRKNKMATDKTMRDWALYYASQGLRIIPLHEPLLFKDGTGNEIVGCSCEKSIYCDNIAKHPRWGKNTLEHGTKDATTDAAIISSWWTTWPDANIGVCCGKQPDGSGLVCIDLDSHTEEQNGMAALTRWQTEHGLKFPETWTVKTGSGSGIHMYYRTDGRSIKQRADWLGDNCGIDVRYNNCYAILPPSLHKSDRRYEWISADDVKLADANEAVYQFLDD